MSSLVGSGPEVLEPLLKLQKEGHASMVKLQATHCNSSGSRMTQGIEFARNGGYVDVTAGVSPSHGSSKAIKPSECVKRFMDEGLPLRQITMSSDGNGNSVNIAEDGTIQSVRVLLVRRLYEEFVDLVLKEGFRLSDALRVVSTNNADNYGLRGKGRVRAGGDADLVVLDEGLKITDVFCRGSRMVENGQIVARGLFEKGS